MVLGSFTNESCASRVVITSHINLKIYTLSFKYISYDTGTIFEAMILVFSQIGTVYGHWGNVCIIFMHCFWAYLC